MHSILDEQAIANSPEAYERLLLDCLNGDPTNFTHWKEVEQSWKFVDYIRQTWDNNSCQLFKYESGSMGPKESLELLERDGFEWISFNWAKNYKHD